MFCNISRYRMVMGSNIGVKQVRYTLYRHRYTDHHKTRHTKKADYNWIDENWKNEKSQLEGHIDEWYKIQETDQIRCETIESELYTNGSSSGLFDSLNETLATKTAIKNIAEAELGPVIEENLKLSGISKFNQLQRHAIPLVKNNQNIFICAPKGSGKIAAFLAPIISSIEAGFESGRPLGRTPLAIITVPSAEIGRQIFHEALKIGYRTRVKPTISVSEDGIEYDMKDHFRLGSDMLITSPDDLLTLMSSRSPMLNNVQFLVHYDLVKRESFHDCLQSIFKYQWTSFNGKVTTSLPDRLLVIVLL